ncbi:MAG: hypothetical protein ABS81_09685 [Pseudonocardia sp. SCN 72-86]|nr:MAG: hypothetical protein ABS81_09685 [Pseudonocardia sp. SCN 72-86]
MLPPLDLLGSAGAFENTFRLAELVDELGYHGGYLGHHSFHSEVGLPASPFVVLAGIAARTTNFRIGTGIHIANLHHPLAIAEHVQQLDQISGGRVTLGVGVGYRRSEFDGFGVDFTTRGKRLTEMITVWRNGWTTGTFEHDGPMFVIPPSPVWPPCVQKPHPPIMVGGTSAAAVTRAATLGDGWFTSNPLDPMSEVVEETRRYREAAEAAGREPYICLLRQAWVAPSEREVEEQWLDPALAFIRSYYQAGSRGAEDTDPILRRVVAGERPTCREFAHDRAIAGTPDFCVEQLGRWHERIGFDEVSLLFGGPKAYDSLATAYTLFAREVVPAFRDS